MSRTVKRNEARQAGRTKCPACGRLVAIVRLSGCTPFFRKHRTAKHGNVCPASHTAAAGEQRGGGHAA